ncbi:helix-turn-helix domain-containing protein [Actinocrinis puniceicyclus]|uniref:Helix-turn-helix domain-containing protein n=1 Tax=Actinocrinis puniceicyclus TaxID=977794 RepID=A0A8J7WPL7_9ACTN|nr:helix-turn-helix domain-containing protein [Actinocrinis puniceicyclus]MBS2965163.1 helix-turn-helix domain-containing protein [Actinocrinis puniceicyclus]
MNTDRTLADPAPAAALGESRSRVLDLLRSADGQLGVQEIAERAGLHPNTARFHLDALVEAGLAERASEGGGQPGRPRTIYRARPAAAAAGQRSYRLLAEILTTLVAEHLPQPQRSAAEAGRTWGGYLIDRPAPFEHVDTREAVERLVGVLAEMGFDPEVEKADQGTDENGGRVRLHHCPFREVAEHHRDVVCSLHLGLMQGALAELRTPVAADRLDPFVEPNLCIAHLSLPNQAHTSD